MRYAIFTDIHANLEALEAVLAKIDELAEQTPIDQIWFLGDLVGYGPNPNECIDLLRTRTDVMLAGNHDWAAIGKLDLEDFSPVARISAEWTTQQLTKEHSSFLENLPERIVLDDCTLVHGSPYGPLWEYLTSEALAERSFQYFDTRYCFVGHTHVPIIFQQPDALSNTPTVPLTSSEENMNDVDDDEETQKLAVVRPIAQTAQNTALNENSAPVVLTKAVEQNTTQQHEASSVGTDDGEQAQLDKPIESDEALEEVQSFHNAQDTKSPEDKTDVDIEPNLDAEVEELLALLGLSQSMVKVTNEMLVPPIGDWSAPEGYRAIVNPGGVGQPRDGNPQAAFMIYDTEKGFTFYRVPYDYEKTQKKIIEAGLPSYLAARLAYGR